MRSFKCLLSLLSIISLSSAYATAPSFKGKSELEAKRNPASRSRNHNTVLLDTGDNIKKPYNTKSVYELLNTGFPEKSAAELKIKTRTEGVACEKSNDGGSHYRIICKRESSNKRFIPSQIVTGDDLVSPQNFPYISRTTAEQANVRMREMTSKQLEKIVENRAQQICDMNELGRMVEYGIYDLVHTQHPDSIKAGVLLSESGQGNVKPFLKIRLNTEEASKFHADQIFTFVRCQI